MNAWHILCFCPFQLSLNPVHQFLSPVLLRVKKKLLNCPNQRKTDVSCAERKLVLQVLKQKTMYVLLPAVNKELLVTPCDQKSGWSYTRVRAHTRLTSCSLGKVGEVVLGWKEVGFCFHLPPNHMKLLTQALLFSFIRLISVCIPRENVTELTVSATYFELCRECSRCFFSCLL